MKFSEKIVIDVKNHKRKAELKLSQYYLSNQRLFGHYQTERGHGDLARTVFSTDLKCL